MFLRVSMEFHSRVSSLIQLSFGNKGNNKIIEHRAIFQKLISQQTDKISQQPENWENRNGPDLIQAFPKKWWVESDFTAPNLPLPLRLNSQWMC
jgi:hypothetical protein